MKRFFSYFLTTLIIQQIHCQAMENTDTIPSTYQHKANGLQSVIMLSPHPEDSTIEITCTLKNISKQPLYFLRYMAYDKNPNNPHDNYFRIEYDNISKPYSIKINDTLFRQADKAEKRQFYGVETVYVHFEWMTYFKNNHVMDESSCFETELSPGKVLEQKAMLKIDIKMLKYIDVSIDFLKKGIHKPGAVINEARSNHSSRFSLK